MDFRDPDAPTCRLHVWPLPATAAFGPGPDAIIAVDSALVLRTMPGTFQQQTCRRFLAKAFERFQGELQKKETFCRLSLLHSPYLSISMSIPVPVVYCSLLGLPFLLSRSHMFSFVIPCRFA